MKAKVGNKTIYGNRVYKTLAGARKSIKSKTGKSYIRKNHIKGIHPVKQRKMNI